jgi:hypothetical protein
MNETNKEGVEMTNTNIDYSKSQNGTELLGTDRKPFKRYCNPFLTYDQNAELNMRIWSYDPKGRKNANINISSRTCMGNKTFADDLAQDTLVWYTKNGVSLQEEQVEYFYNVHNPKATKGTLGFQNCGLKGFMVQYSNSNLLCKVCVSFRINIAKYINPVVWERYCK